MKLKYRVVRPALRTALILFPLTAVIAGGILPALTKAISVPRDGSFVRNRKNAVITNLPHSASVLATFDFLPRLANRRELYSLHHVYSGYYTLSDIPYPTPDVDYLIMDTNDRLTFSTNGFYGSENYRRLQALLNKSGWQLVEHVNSLLVFRKSSSTATEKLCLAEQVDVPADMNRNVDQVTDADIQLVGFKTGMPDKDNIMPLTFYWEKTRSSPKDYDMHLTVIGESVLFSGILSPGSRIQPPQSWPINTPIADKHRVRLENGRINPENIKVRMELIPLN